jgi:hypothetical protein
VWVATAIRRDAASCTWNTSAGEITVRSLCFYFWESRTRGEQSPANAPGADSRCSQACRNQQRICFGSSIACTQRTRKRRKKPVAAKPPTRRFCCTVPLASAGPAPLSPSPPCCPSLPCRLAASFRPQLVPKPGVNQHIPSDLIQQTSCFNRPNRTRRERRLGQIVLAISSAPRSTGCGISGQRWRRLRSKSRGSLIASGRRGGRARMITGRVGVRRRPCSRETSARRST